MRLQVYVKLGKRDIRLSIVAGVIGALGVVAVAITLAVMLPGRSVDSQSETLEPAESETAEWVGIDDLLLENELERGTAPRWIPYREMKERWNETDAARHWIDPRAIGVEVLEEEVTSSIQRMLEEVP